MVLIRFSREGLRCFNIATVCLLVLMAVGSDLPAQEKSELDARRQQLKDQRRDAAHRQRRLIFNNDGNEPVYHLGDAEVSAEAFLADRTTALVGTHVDSIFYCSWGTGLGLFTHISDVAEPFYTTEGVVAPNRTKEFHDKGLDPLKIMVDFCKSNDTEIFWSLRMNDVHDSYPAWSMMLPQFKKDHPELLFAASDQNPPFGRWSGLDYGQEAVRDRAFALLEDVCKRYDVDGVELDFMRHMPHFKCNSQGEDCTDKERALMTGLLQRIRKMTEEVGLNRGRPILIAVRIPASIACCEAGGLDVVRWLEEDCVDLLVPGEWELSPWEEMITLGHSHNVPVYPCLSWTGSKKRRGPPEIQEGLAHRNFRARAMNIWRSGADGVYSFNLPDGIDPTNSLWHQLGDPQVLAGLDKDYFPHGNWRILTGNPEFPDQERFAKPFVPPFPERPVRLERGQQQIVVVDIGDKLTAAADNQPQGKAVKLSVNVASPHTAVDLKVALNGNALEARTSSDQWITYDVPSACIKTGPNSVSVSSISKTEEDVVLQDVLVQVANSSTDKAAP